MVRGRILLLSVSACVAAGAFIACADGPPPSNDWWSLRPLARPDVPFSKAPDSLTADERAWIRTPVDAFVLAELRNRSLGPQPPAVRDTLIRRATFDLLGLPPTPEEIDAFMNDAAPDAYERLIDRLLASPHYGERWARHWLDVARFSESQGFERDIIRDHAWRYRDYVIRSLNDDKPYDQFVREQIAGDVIEPVTQDGIAATGFLVAGPFDEAGSGSASQLLRARIREEELEDMIGTVGQTFLGLTVNCARCHDHKFDPIPQRDYYRLKSVFDGVRHGNRSALAPDEQQALDGMTAVLTRRIEALERRIAAIDRTARDRILERRKVEQKATEATEIVPRPFAKWSFESDACDEMGELHATLKGGATLAKGRLQLGGKGQFAETVPLPRDVREKTLEMWASLADESQRGGAPISIETIGGRQFDAIVYGEREPKKWIAGSSFYQRTKDLAAEPESTKTGELVHVAIVYRADDRIAVFRNGAPYGEPYTLVGTDATLRKFAANESHVLFGLRHTGAGNGFFAGEIEEARLYDRALTDDEVVTSYRAGVPIISLDNVLAALEPAVRDERTKLSEELNRRRDEFKSLPPAPQVYAANPKPAEPTHVLLSGDVEKKGDPVTAGGLSCVASPPANFGLEADSPDAERRRQFAEWIASTENPLPARVMVNRVWHYHFGRGIVGTPNDLGSSGDRPSHPALLDWLAAEFMQPNVDSRPLRPWSIKHLHRLIMLSSTYQQSSAFSAGAAAVDADDRLLWRFPPRRLEGEAVRDAMLAVSGQLNRATGGPSFRPFELKIFNSHFYNLNDPVGPEFNRRTVYRVNVNSAKDPLLESMDCPDPSTKTPRRTVTTTPIQALGLMNNSFVERQSRQFAERVRRDAGNDLAEQITLAYRLALGRRPTQTESARAAELARGDGLDAVCWVLFNSSEFQYSR